MSDLFFRKPRLLVLTVLLVLVAGLSALSVLPRAEDPELTGRNAVVFTSFPGADAERVESLITERIEDQLDEFSEIKEVISTSRRGLSSVQIELADEIYDADPIWSRIRDKVSDIESELPSGALAPELDEFEISAYTLLVGLTWREESALPPSLLSRLAESLGDRLRAVSGTKEVDFYGESEEEIRVQLDAAALASRGIHIGDVAQAVRAADAKVSAGHLRATDTELLIQVSGEIESLDRVRQIPIRVGSSGEVVRLSDIATVAKGERDPPAAKALVAGRPGVVIAARMNSGRRVDQWAANAREAVAAFGRELPAGVQLDTLFDQSRYTEQRLNQLFQNLVWGAVLVMIVVMLTMGLRSAALVGLALPLSGLLVLQGMRMLGIAMHQMSIAGLIIALGLLIDNAIVIVDEVRHRLEAGDPPQRAVSQAVRTLAVPLMGSTVTTVLAFAPIALMPGGAGEFVGPMALSVILALVGSLALSLTVIASLAGMFRSRPGRSMPGPLRFLSSGLTLGPIAGLYRRVLRFFLRLPVLAILLACIAPIFGFIRAADLREQFFPPADRDQFQVEVELSQGTSLERTTEVFHSIRAELLDHPAVVEVHGFLGESAPKFYYNQVEGRRDSPGFGMGLVQLDRSEGTIGILAELQERLDRTARGARVLVKQIEQGPPFDAPIEVHLLGPDVATLQRLGEVLRTELASVEGVVHTRSSSNTGSPSMLFQVDEEAARRVGLRNEDLALLLASDLDGVASGSFVEATEELPVRLRVGDETGRSPQELLGLEVAGSASAGSNSTAESTGGWVPLGALGTWHLTPQAAAITRRDGIRSNSVQAFLVPGTLPSVVLERLESRLEADVLPLPNGYRLEIGGEAAERDEAVGNLAATAGILFVLMAAALVLSFSSFRLAALIGTVGMLSIGLALLAISLFGFPFGFMAIVGSMGLVGVSINDSIVVLAALRDDPVARTGDLDAVVRVVFRSTRHVLTTSLTTMVGFLPLYLSGGGFWPPVAAAIGGGVAGATLIALTLLPAGYRLLYFRRAKQPVTAEQLVLAV